MPTPQKEAIIQEMTEKFSNASSIFVADFSGVDVNTITELRRGFREAKVEYRVMKNTLARMSLKNAGIDGLNEFLVGVNSYAISYDDPTLPIKVVEKFNKDKKTEIPIKVAFFEGQLVAPEKVADLAKLPSKHELLGQLMGMLKSPMSKFVGTLNASMQNVVGVLKALEEKKQ